MCIIKEMADFRIRIVGAGKVGMAFAWHLQRLGYEVCEITDLSRGKVRFAWRLLQKSKVCSKRKGEGFFHCASHLLAQNGRNDRSRGGKSQNSEVKNEAVFFTVPDSEIEEEFKRRKRQFAPGTIVVHCSGVYGTEVFKGRGVESLALHPVRSFWTVEQAIADLPGSFFALDGTKEGLRFGKEIVRRLSGKSVIVPGRDRPLYHAMCVFASNFLNALFQASESIGKAIGVPERKARMMLTILAQGVLENIKKKGPIVTLTGPIRRGDKRTVRLHIKSLRKRFPEHLSLYKELTRRLEKIKSAKW